MSDHDLKFFQDYGYRKDREQRLRNVANGREDSLSMEAANQIKHLKSCLSELVSIVEIHSDATGRQFAIPELLEAQKALEAGNE